MLPTSGYFRGINCPGHEKGLCSRPFCHFHHSSKKETSSGAPNVSSSVEQEKADGQTKAKSSPLVKRQSTEGSPSCSKSEDPTNPVTPDVDDQSDLLQQLVSEAVKKVLIENPHLASVGVNPSTLIAHTTAEVSPVNSGSKKKYYPRPPDTPSYNPTPIRELNKRKRSNEGQDDLPSNSKAAKYVPAALDSQNIISDATKHKDSGDSDATDFSSPEDEDLDQQNCDFDILEEVLAEHSQNKKIKVKKKKVKALGKLQYNLTNNDKKVDESSMISDAQIISDQDSNTCDGPKSKSKDGEEQQPGAASYFLPPSPIFTSSSDGFGAYNSVSYAKSETDEEKDKGENAEEDPVLAEPLQDCDRRALEEDTLESIRNAIQSKERNCVKKSVSKGHSMLPKFVHALGAPRMARPNIRSWNPQGRSGSTAADATKDSSGGDPLEAMLQQMDGDQTVAKESEKGVAAAAADPIKDVATKTTARSPKNSKKYKVDLDKEIKSLATSPSLTDENREKVADKETGITETGHNERGHELAKKTSDADEKTKPKENEDSELHDKESSKNVVPREKQEKPSKSRKLESKKEKSVDAVISSKGSHSERESEGGDSVDRDGKSCDESEGEQDSRKRKRKRDHSSGSDSQESYHRKKKKKSHKRRKKYKKRRRRKDSRSGSGDSDVDSVKDDNDNEEEENKEKKREEKLDSSETNDKEENEKVKKHKKRKKKRHRKKSKHRKRSKNKMRKKNRSRSASLSSSQERSRSTSLRRSSSRHRSRSSSRHGSHDRHGSRSNSEHRSRSNSRHRNRKNSRYHSSSSRSRSRSRNSSSSRHRSRNSSKRRSRSNTRGRSRSRSNSRCKSRSRSNSRQHASRSRSRSKSRHRSQSSTNYRSRRSSSRHVSRSPSKDRCSSQTKGQHGSQSKTTGQEIKNSEAKHKRENSRSHSTQSADVSTKNDKDRVSAISIPMPIDPSKIKVEKDLVSSSASVIVPDLSIVKKEKEEVEPSLPCTATVKIEKTKESQNEKQRYTSELGDQPERTGKQSDLLNSSTSTSLGKHLSSHDSVKRSSDDGLGRRESSSHQRRPSKEASLQDSHQKKEGNRTSEGKERRKSNAERRSSSESTSNQKSNCHSNTEKEHSHSKAPASVRRVSTSEKIKENSLSSSFKESHPKGLSIFDMVEASIQPSKPKVLKEISIFDKVSAIGYESSSDSTIPSDLDLPDVLENKDKSPDQSSANRRKKLRQSLSAEKFSSDVKAHKDKSHLKSGKEKDPQGRSSSSSQSKSKAHQEHKSASTHSSSSSSKHSSHSSSSKHSSSQQSSSHIHKSSSTLPKSSSNSSKGVTNENDAVGSSSGKSSHASNSVSSKSKAKSSSSSSSSSKQELCHSTSKHSGHHRKHSTSSVDKEKEHSKATHKNRDQRKESSSKEKECSSSSSHHSSSRGKGSLKDSADAKKDHKSGRSHCSKHKEDGKSSRRDKGKEVVCNNKKSSLKEGAEMEESSSDSDRDLYGANDDDNGCADDDDDGDAGNNSPFPDLPDLSALDEIPQDDWEQLINSSEDDLKHLEDLRSDDFDLDDLDKDDPGIMEECLQMYNDYKPDPDEIGNRVVSKKKAKVDPKEELELLPSKHRVARTTTGGNLLGSKPNVEPRARKKTPAQVMMERYQQLKEQQAELLKQLEKQKQQLEEQGRGVAAGASSSSSSHAVSSTTSPRSRPGVVSSSSVSSTTSSRSKIAPASSTSLKSSPHSTSGAPKRRMSHVPNVTSLLQAREKIKNLPPPKSRSLLSPNVAKASGVIPQTIAHTVAKGGRRFAHVPKVETLKRPSITPEFGSKVPPNIRQRYLNSLIDECLKFLGQREAFNLGLAEEKVCFQRASSRMVYLNLAVNAVKRLRNQQEAGEAAQELLETDPMFKDATYAEDPSAVEKPSTSRVSSTQSSEVKPHPINPNHSRLSHFSVLAVGGQRGSWSIEKPKKNTASVQNCLKGVNFYNMIKKYILNEQQLGDNGYPCPDPDEKGKAIVKVVDHRKKLSPSSVERYCDRCSVLYTVDKWGFPLSVGPCVHHWGRPYKQRGYAGWESRYSCCGGDSASDGCCQATTHVSHNYDPNKLRGYVRTLPKDVKDNDYGVYALDCEMCYTTGGCELTRVTVVDSEGNTVYEQLVKPENPIIDYNTRFSGITESDMEDVKTNIRDVQASLLTKFSDKSILIGHSLESDFHALKLIHDTVVDTSVVFPHKMGPPYKRALKNLASEYLKKIIQNDVSGHDSAEDAIACMHLMQWRVKEDLKGFGMK